jgi:heparan-alpha-glucosaminide N-acetyltransferase
MAFERRPEPDIKVAPAVPRPATPAPGTRPPAPASTPQRPEMKRPDANRPPAPATAPSERLVSLDAFRGAIMLLLASGALHLAAVVKNIEKAGYTSEDLPHRVASFWSLQFSHVPWQGGVLWDMIQPAFMFMVGAALPFSFARRAARGDSYISRFLHALIRSLMLILLGVFLSSNWSSETNWTFANVLCQIGLGYMFVFLLVNRGVWLQGIVLLAIAGGWWYAFYQHPLPPEGFDYATVGVPPAKAEAGREHSLETYVLPGLFGHWSMNTNFAAAQDKVILNKFPRSTPFEFNSGGYATLNFVPSIITMLLGLMIGELLRGTRTGGQKLVHMLIAAAVCVGVGVALHFTVCPIIKRIWTPSWALASSGAVIAALALFYLVFDLGGWKRLAWPLVVVGMNSLLVYLMGQMLKGWTGATIKRHFSMPWRHFADWFNARGGTTVHTELFGGVYGPLWESLSVMFVFWLVCVWLYRQKIFVRM